MGMKINICLTIYFLLFLALTSCQRESVRTIHIYELVEIILTAEKLYDNPYMEVETWVRLTGPDFDKKIYGFWDGKNIFKVRVVAINPGEWSWTSGCTNPNDNGLNGKTGKFRAIEWTEAEKHLNPNRRGFIRPTSNGHALQYSDGTPFFFIGDTWWAASTWRYPLTGVVPDPGWKPGAEGLTFENIVQYRQKQGYNSLAMIACYPSWDTDSFPGQYSDENGIGIRQAWEKFGTPTAKDMHDESGNLSFDVQEEGPLADFDKINPSYFQSLDKKMKYLDSQGFVPFLETVRRDHGPSWKAYYDWPESFIRYIQYIVARYGAFNMIFSPVHLDWIPPVYSLSGEEFNEAITDWYRQYGELPYGQPVTVLIDGATHKTLGIGEEVPWISMHSVGNSPRNHGFYPLLEEQFRLQPPKPTANLEAYYPGWNHDYHNTVAGEKPEPGSDRDNYFGRTQAWGSIMSGGIAGHIYGTGAYDGTTAGEEAGIRPFIWEGLNYPAGQQVGYIRKFIESFGKDYQDFELASAFLQPRKSDDCDPAGLDGWAFMMRSPDRTQAMLYFENRSQSPLVSGMLKNTRYRLNWFNPVSGEWLPDSEKISSNVDGSIHLSEFPDGKQISSQDWALKLKMH